jgi:hypothetical protein
MTIFGFSAQLSDFCVEEFPACASAPARDYNLIYYNAMDCKLLYRHATCSENFYCMMGIRQVFEIVVVYLALGKFDIYAAIF